MTSEYKDALTAASESFGLCCDWKMAKALQIIYREITSGEKCSNFTENVYVAARNGIEILRTHVSLRKQNILKHDHCPMNWNTDMILYVISCLLLIRKMPFYVHSLKKEDKSRFYTDSVFINAKNGYENNIPFTSGKSAFELNVQQLIVCALSLGNSCTDSIDWYSYQAWHVYETVECCIANAIVDTIQGKSLDLCTPTADDFPACAMFCNLASITAVCRIHRRAASSVAKLVFNEAETLTSWIEANMKYNTVDECAIQTSIVLSTIFTNMFKEFDGERQDTALDHAHVVQKCTLTDIEFASYCTTMGNVLISSSASMLALHSQSAITSLSWSQSVRSFAPRQDLHVLKLANFYFSTIMNLHLCKPQSSSWLQLFVLTHKDWVQRVQKLRSLKWHTPIIAHLGVTLGWSVIFWTKTNKVKIQTMCASTIPQNTSALLLCIVIWMQLRIHTAESKPSIEYENGTMKIKFKELCANK